jgi:hypothetical protein
MNTNSVQSAFSVSPTVGGSFSWSPVNDTLTFTPGGGGMAGLTNIVVRITNSAFDSISSNRLFAPYELKFKTAATSIHDTNPPVVFLQTPTNGAVISGTLAVSGTATDNVAVAKVEWQLDNFGWQTTGGTVSWSASLNSSNFLNGPHGISARATDSSGNVSATNSVEVKFFNVPGNYLQRVSGGNPASVTDCSANVWLADRAYTLGAFGYSGGTTGYVANTISGVCPAAQSLYQRERYSTSSGGFFYEFDCPEGIYETTLLEAETYWSGAGQRVFNVFIQGQPVLTNFDIYASAGGQNIPTSRIFTNAVTNSQLLVRFTPVIDNARVSGVQVRKIADVFSDTDGIPDWWRLAYFGHALGSAADLSRGSDDADGDGVSNLTEFSHGTDPLNAGSFPTLPPFSIGQIAAMGNSIQLSWSTVTNWTYLLQWRSVLAPFAPWVTVGPAIFGTGGVMFLNAPVSASNGAVFYRIQAR